jgi:hypothetical protein
MDITNCSGKRKCSAGWTCTAHFRFDGKVGAPALAAYKEALKTRTWQDVDAQRNAEKGGVR